MNEQLDIRRLLHLLRGDITSRYRTILITSAAIAGVMVILTILFQLDAGGTNAAYSMLTWGMLFIWAPIAASFSFRELHDKTRNGSYLILPASALEKMLVRLALITLVFVVFTVVFVTVLSWLTTALQAITVGRAGPAFSPTPVLRPEILGYFLVNQSIYFLGAAWFRRQHFIKTVLALTVLAIGLTVFTGVTIRVFFPDIANVNFDVDPETWFTFWRQSMLVDVLWFVYFAVLPAACWLVVWLRIRETQVSHGV